MSPSSFANSVIRASVWNPPQLLSGMQESNPRSVSYSTHTSVTHAVNSNGICANLLATIVRSSAAVRHPAKFFAGILLALLVLLLTATAVGSRSSMTDHLRPRQLDFLRAVTYEPRQPASLPAIVLWAWERPEDFRFLDGNDAGVAFLAKTIILPPSGQSPRNNSGFSVLVRPRLQPLRVSPGTPLIAVVRIETALGRKISATSANADAAHAHPYSVSEIERIAREIADLQNLAGVRAIQIDYDATVSERPFYAALLSDVGSRLSTAIPLSITALASWCIGDPWLERLPAGTIQEAVPMLFRMGPDSGNVRRFLASGENFPAVACQGSLGLSTDEPFSREMLTKRQPWVPASHNQKRLYVFSPRAWTASAADKILKEWHQ